MLLMFVFQGLKSHAVTMFEVGKLSDESLDSFLMELEKIRVRSKCRRTDICQNVVLWKSDLQNFVDLI